MARAFVGAFARRVAFAVVAAVVALLSSWCSVAQAQATCTTYRAREWLESSGTLSGTVHATRTGACMESWSAWVAARAALSPPREAELLGSISPTSDNCGVGWRERTSGGSWESYGAPSPTLAIQFYSVTVAGACPLSCAEQADAINAQPAATQRGYSAFQGSSSCTHVIAGTGTCLLAGSFSARLTPTSPWIASGPFSVYSGPSCGTANTPTSPTLPAQLPPGMCPGEVNGAPVTVPCGEASGTGSTTTNTGSGGTATGSSTTTTSCTATSCTTTTTNRDGSGSITSTSSTTSPRPDFCGQNPGAGACRGTGAINGPGTGGSGSGTGGGEEEGGGSFSGSCVGGFTCEGDAVQCAMARDQHVRHCQAFDLPNDLSNVGTPAMSGEAQPAGHPGASPEAASLQFSTVIDQSDRLPGSCPGDIAIPVPVGSGSIVLPLSEACGSLEILGHVLVGICMLAALRIVFV